MVAISIGYLIKYATIRVHFEIILFYTSMIVQCRVGRNVGAGMTGGLAYFLDEDDTFTPKVLSLQLILLQVML